MKKIASWEDCIDKFYAIKITPDKAKARSLIKTSTYLLIFCLN